LSEMGFEIISTGGTAKALEEADIPVVPVSKVTGAPEILGGRVKTLHPKVHGGILADLEDPDHVTQLVDHDIAPIDLVCINLYPFEATIAGGASEKEAIEQIDIGGPAMIRAAAKNFKSVTVVPSPEFYEEVLSELETDNSVSDETRRRLALAAFRRTAKYDAAISAWMENGGEFPETLHMRYEKALPLRYGENPHQRAAYYARVGEKHLLSGVERLQGKDLSFNNLHDVDAARALLADLEDSPAAVIVKHANPCGVAVAEDISKAYRQALASDPLSAFGGIVALNAPVDGELAAEITKVFTEVLISPDFTPDAMEALSTKPNMTVLRAGPLALPKLTAKDVTGGLLLQDTDATEDTSGYQVVAGEEPAPETMRDLLFAWRIAKRVRSNAIVLARGGSTVGIGGGLTSRVDAAELAVKKAGERARGAVAASDAFFPFADGIEALAEAGIQAVIQPGGSRRDDEVVEAANRHGVAMVFTGRRHFLH
ncbi:MAG TPA: bifunctional phosphoribosylaminoimidazolecarboxamide formyltransferase/IMP cyclohydrolase, partial [Rubrobacteraceae bacterium]|nr:bifunctional phosphoribosylaminoimidazolecarboxamide formyltransferase/IMP cyclohydrolase [Rubrobacteraceae bacterium]